ncbi:MAG: extracellular solute-binding protein [Rhizobiaceae bacterium]|nr:extracellular solute-binding protein [Rhizobiaceae bacterium]
MWEFVANLSDQERVTRLAELAAKEDQIVVYGVLGIDRAQILIDHFKTLYPDLNVTFVRLTVAQAAQKLQAERDAGRSGADVLLYSLTLLDRLQEFLAPYEPLAWGDFDPRFRYGSASEGWTALGYEILPFAIAWRTDRIPRENAPRSFEALIDGQWNGKIGSVLNMEPFVAGLLDIYGEQKGMEWVEAFGGLDSILYPSVGGLAGALASGEIDIAWGIGGYRAAALKASGAPIDFEFENPTFATGLAVSVAKGAAHPYGAALFMEFLTDAKVLETLDLIEPGRIFANRAGNYTNHISDFENLYVNKSMTDEQLKPVTAIVEKYFLRR